MDVFVASAGTGTCTAGWDCAVHYALLLASTGIGIPCCISDVPPAFLARAGTGEEGVPGCDCSVQ
jgi:hypothetical protein